MNAVEVFDFQEQAVRALIGPDGEWWFVGRDVTAALGIANGPQAIGRLDEDEKGICNVDTLGGQQQMLIISEPGCYRLVFTSRTDKAEAFKRWLAHEVLPSLRKTGRYEMPASPSAPLADGPMLVAGLDLEIVRTWLNVIREGRSIHGKAFAQRLWCDSPLPQPAGMIGVSPVAAFAEACIYAAPGVTVPARTMAAAGFGKDMGRVRMYRGVALRQGS